LARKSRNQCLDACHICFPEREKNRIRKEQIMVRRMGIGVFGRFVTAIVALIALGTCLSFAQTSTATILGTVKDASGALVPGVSITVKHTESGLTRSVVSGERVGYTVPLLPVGA